MSKKHTSIFFMNDKCYDKGCICMGDDYDTIEYNMSLGWSMEISQALLGENKYG